MLYLGETATTEIYTLSSTTLFRSQGWGHAGPGHHHRYLGPGGRGFDYGPGDRMPPQYMGEHYWIGDYGHYGLPPPPPGDRWMYDPDGNYVLVSMATSMVVEALLHSRW